MKSKQCTIWMGTPSAYIPYKVCESISQANRIIKELRRNNCNSYLYIKIND